jgi:CheY-like chemotaxis protein
MRPPSHQNRILLVDDESSVLAAMGFLLQSAGYRVQSAASGVEALALLENNPFDLLITDNHMPGMSGVDLAMTSRARWPRLPIFMFTAYPPAAPLYCLDLVLVKPHGVSRLLPSVAQVLHPDHALTSKAALSDPVH